MIDELLSKNLYINFLVFISTLLVAPIHVSWKEVEIKQKCFMFGINEALVLVVRNIRSDCINPSSNLE